MCICFFFSYRLVVYYVIGKHLVPLLSRDYFVDVFILFSGSTKKTETKDDTLDPTYGEVC